MNKRAKVSLVFLGIFTALILISIMYFVFAAHTITPDVFSVNEDVGFVYNITINNTDVGQAANITEVNLTISSFNFLASSQGTTSSGDFTNTSSVLSWSNFTDYLINGSEWKNFWFNATIATPGTYNLSVLTTNATGSYQSNITVTVNDTTDPSSIQFVFPTDSSGANLSRSYIIYNVTATDNGQIDTIIVRLYNSSNAQINSSTSSSSPLYGNFAGLADGTYYINASVNDTYNNPNSTIDTRAITLDTTAPAISIMAPGNTTYDNATQLVNISTTGASSVWFFNGTGNESYTDVVYRTFSEGSNTLTAWANDSIGNLNSTSVIFTIDTTAPAVTINLPSNTTYTTSSINFNFSLNEAGYCEYSLNNGATNSTMTANSSNTGFNATNTSIADGSYTTTAYCNDTAGNKNYTTTKAFSKDTTYPLISFETGREGNYANVSRNWTYVNVSFTESNFANITFSLYNDTAAVNSTTYTTATYTINWTSLPPTNYSYEVNITDTANNKNSTGRRYIRLDITAPTLDIIDIDSITSSGAALSVTTSEIVSSCSYSGAGSGSLTGSGTTWSATLSSLSSSTEYDVDVTCTDLAGNSGTGSKSFTTSSSGGGGGSSSGGATETKKSIVWAKITPGSATIWKVMDKALGVKQISITVNNPAQNVKITITKYDSKPAKVTKEKSGKVYKYLSIDESNLAKNLSKAVITIQVEKSWLTSNDFTKEKVALFKYDNSSNVWNEISTTFTSNDSTYYYYDVELTSFSYFAIAEKTAAASTTPTTTPSTNATTPTTTPTGGEGEKSRLWLWILIIVVIALIATVIIYYSAYREKRYYRKGH